MGLLQLYSMHVSQMTFLREEINAQSEMYQTNAYTACLERLKRLRTEGREMAQIEVADCTYFW
jgi:hypothetical protein